MRTNTHPKLRGVTVMDKGERPKYDEFKVYDKSSNPISYNLYDQDWETVKQLGLSYLFNHDEVEFNERVEEYASENKQGITQ